MGRIAVVGLGGTISMAASPDGLTPVHGVEGLLAALPPVGLGDVELVPHDLAAIGSANLGWDHLYRLRDLLQAHFAAGGRGAVVVQGTDVLEEMAFATELLGPGGGPVVFAGAMRGAGEPGGDGPANLLAALRVAAQAPAGMEVSVVLNNTVHAARRVRKGHTTAPDAFTSGEAGPLGALHEGALELFVDARPPLAPVAADGPVPPVAIVPVMFGMTPQMLPPPDAPWAGFVIEAFGAGHVPEALVPALAAMAARAPTVLSSRVGDGRVCRATYGYPGAERDLLARGLVPGGRLGAAKARIALQLCLAADPDGAREAFVRLSDAIR